MPNVSYLRLDGSVPVSQRYALVNRFNVDPSIDTLIMTTQVGGLGLNLTGADTVCCMIYSLPILKLKLMYLIRYLITVGNFCRT